MSSIRRTSWTPLGRPVAGDLIRTDSGPAVPVSLGFGEELYLDDPAWGRDLIAAVTAGVSVLESEHGLPAPERMACDPIECVHEAARGQAEEEREVYRALLTRLTMAERPWELWPAIRDASLALEHWGSVRAGQGS